MRGVKSETRFDRPRCIVDPNIGLGVTSLQASDSDVTAIGGPGGIENVLLRLANVLELPSTAVPEGQVGLDTPPAAEISKRTVRSNAGKRYVLCDGERLPQRLRCFKGKRQGPHRMLKSIRLGWYRRCPVDE